jgi:hypothetical protein
LFRDAVGAKRNYPIFAHFYAEADVPPGTIDHTLLYELGGIAAGTLVFAAMPVAGILRGSDLISAIPPFAAFGYNVAAFAVEELDRMPAPLLALQIRRTQTKSVAADVQRIGKRSELIVGSGGTSFHLCGSVCCDCG